MATEQVFSWTDRLTAIAQEPLEFCEDFPRIAQRFEAWWHQAVVDRPVFMAEANTGPDRPITRRLELMHEPDAWFHEKILDIQQMHRVGEMLPRIRVDFGPVLLGVLLGGRREVRSDTSWTHAFIDDDWSNAPDWTIPDDHPDWRLLRELSQRVARDAAGRYLVCTPDLGAAADVLLNLRGSAQLCLDVVTRPDTVKAAVDAIYASWQKAFASLYATSLEHGAGLIHWLGLWSNRPYGVPACDFNALIGPDHFRELFLPEIAREAATAGRAVFHLDGPDAARHIETLLEVPEIQAIQFTPGAGSPSALAWLDMLRRIQGKGRSLLIFCPAEEVLTLAELLRPDGLAIFIEQSPAPVELDALFNQFKRRY
ncbi:hypothetical protein [Anaerobaca lacustris]|uniref:Trimethylamine corrinoid protein 2 n=1 Tax=Anaerobaca lacustris TaxID=3044600 RepID=A0AAW6TSF5_9BACT|nr:hypothetical protein [Sedimentisphaerales bacterium M17dextr]